MATEVAIAEGKPTEENILKWRAWFLEQWTPKKEVKVKTPEGVEYPQDSIQPSDIPF